MAEKEILDIHQLDIKKKNYAKNILIVSSIVAAILLAFGAIDAYGGLDTPLEWIDFVVFGLLALLVPTGVLAIWPVLLRMLKSPASGSVQLSSTGLNTAESRMV